VTITLDVPEETAEALRRVAGEEGRSIQEVIVERLVGALEAEARDFEEACEGIAAGIADMEAGRTVSLEEVRAQFEAEREARRKARETQAA
jgi:predicted transcriptional regulator